ncbi:MAG TPA: acetate--CoA ligase family protein [Anaerolineales bacterium]
MAKHNDMTYPLEVFFDPRGIAILGASNDPAKLGYAVARNLIESGYRGNVHLVNPKGGSLQGLEMYKSILDVPDPVDLAVVIVPASAASQSLREVGQRGIRAAILTSGGFRETGAVGVELEDEVVRVCQEFGIRMIGPNCVGLLDTHLPFDTTFLPRPLPARGDIALISHSGAFCAAVIDWARGQGFGFSQLASLGNQADLTETDLLAVIANNPHTKTICMYLETISNGQKFYETARNITRRKPVIALKVGRTEAGQKAAASHTGALAGSETSLNIVLEKAGVLRADTAEQMFDWARALSACPLPGGKNIAILTSAGGPGVIATDALEAQGLLLAGLTAESLSRLAKLLPPAAGCNNPVDMLASAGPREYAGCLEILLSDPGVDGVLVITLPPPNHLAEDIADAIIPHIQAAAKPVLVIQMGSHLTATAHAHFVSAGIPVYPFPERGASALGSLSRQAAFISTARERVEKRNFQVAEGAHGSAEELVAAYGIETTSPRLAADPESARQLAAGMMFPLVAKIASPQITHKSDVDGVLLNLKNTEEVGKAFVTLLERAHTVRPDAQLEGITLQRQIGSGQEVIIGAVRDAQFGVLMMFGSGGIETEGLKDVSFGLAPLSRVEAENMLERTWAGKKLAGYRSIKPRDRSAAIDALVRLSWLAIEHPEIAEIEINPLKVLDRGAVALDVRLKRS